MSKRDARRMVAEDDPLFARFWDAYPHRVSKKDARHAWTQLSPTPETVERMLKTLSWQIREWEEKADWYTPPYPASWLRAERWTDEQRAVTRTAPNVSRGPVVPSAEETREYMRKQLA